jgi:hypothetical protein
MRDDFGQASVGFVVFNSTPFCLSVIGYLLEVSL